MRTTPLMFKLAALVMAVNALLHVLAWIPGGFTQSALQLAPVGLLYGLFALGLYQGRRWMAWVVFPVALVGSLAAFITMPSSSVPTLWVGGIIACDVLLVLMMFVWLWQSRERRTAAA